MMFTFMANPLITKLSSKDLQHFETPIKIWDKNNLFTIEISHIHISINQIN